MKKRILIIILIVFIQYTFGIVKNAGTSTGIVLRLPPGGMHLALGSAGVTIKNDIFSAYYNPASIALMTGFSSGFMHSNMIQDIYYDYFSYMNNVKRFTFGMTVIGVWTKVDVYDINNNKDNSITSGEYVFQGTTGYNGFSPVLVGMNLKYYYQRLMAGYDAGSLDWDLGALYDVHEDVTIGLSLQNAFLSRAVPFQVPGEDRKQYLPFVIRLGTSYIPSPYFNKRLMLVTDLEKAIDAPLKLRIGIEYNIKNVVFLRVGYRSIDKFFALKEGITGGVGIKFSGQNLSEGWGMFSGMIAMMDYAVMYNKDLGYLQHNVSFSIKF